MHYTIHQLKIFTKINEYQSITKASEELCLTQPAVSIQLKKFQEQFTIPLTEVIGRQLYVTDFGIEIAATASKILEQLEAIEYKTKAYQNHLAGILKISSASTGKYVMPYFLYDFLNLHRGIDLKMDVTNKSYVIESLKANEIDMALVSVIPEELDTNQIELIKNKLYLVGSPKIHQKIKKSNKKFFSEHPLLFREEGSATRNAMEKFIHEQKLPVYKKIVLTSNEATKQAVIAGLGYSIMPLIGIKNELRNGDLEIIPVKGLPITTDWNLIWLKSKNLSPAASAFLEFLKHEKERIKNEIFDWYEKY